MAATLKLQVDQIEPKFDWVQRDGCDTLLVHVPGYLKENLKVQVTTYRNLRVLGERKINDRKSSRFQKEFSLPEDCDVNGITAKFEGGVLQVKLPKMAGDAKQEEAKQGTEYKEAAAGTAEDEKTHDKADKQLIKSQGTVQDGEKTGAEGKKVEEKAESGAAVSRPNTDEKPQKMPIRKMRTKKATILTVMIVAVAVGLGFGMLRSNMSVSKIISEVCGVTVPARNMSGISCICDM